MTCEICGDGPCWLPTFCSYTEKINAWWATIPPDHPLRVGPLNGLPKGWRTMSVDQLARHFERRDRRHG